MPMMKGHSREVISSNVHEMVKAGHPVKQAVAAALSSARKSKKMMAMGGEVDVDDDMGLGTNNNEQANRSLAEINDQGNYNPAGVENPQMEEHGDMLAKALYKKAQDHEMMSYAMGGLVQDGTAGDEHVGNKPSEDMMDSTEEPMGVEMSSERGMGLSADAMEAIRKKRMKRRMGGMYQG